MPSVIGLFKRDSIGSAQGSRRGSLQSLHHNRLDSPRHSIGSDGSLEMRIAAATRAGAAAAAAAAAAQDDIESGVGAPSGGILGRDIRRGSTFLSTAPILEEETEETEEKEGGTPSSPTGEPSSPKSDSTESLGSPSSPPHSKPTSPSHVSSKPQLHQIDEDEAAANSSDHEASDPHTKL